MSNLAAWISFLKEAAARAKPEDMASFDGCDGIRALAAAMATRVAVAANKTTRMLRNSAGQH